MLGEIKDILVNQLKFLHLTFNWVNVVEVLIIAAFLLLVYQKFIKGTQSEKLVKGIFILLFAWLFSEILIKFNLLILGVFLRTMVSVIMFGAVIIFQPEIRKFLGYLGQSNFFHAHFNKKNLKEEQKVNVIKELIESVKYLSKTRTGALMVLEREEDVNSYSDVGIQLDAVLSTELILTIFHPNTPLHDGAVVISGDTIKSAGVLLPLTEDPKLSWKYGTRHRAAIGMSEVSDSACLVVSEETGDVSIALDGTLRKYEDITKLKKDLEILLGYEDEDIVEENKTVFNFIKIKTKKQASQQDKKNDKMSK
ncbi:MAG: diadenylate cyclase CdaA [Candidatus Gastranaerophilaceae bacterium]|uniref:Diadenylate cyclase n=1 Tax=Candidatus Limenecus avicola TaxID=2840847 RepID=A0A9D1MYP6_9CLOT|nr:diadenylate cyclase CdaA [Clostridium sp.]CDC21926.1 tIGR00159 family protein [Clostridium sp. CAG:306]DAB26658.1 MAG TPA: TIGR00159 family protein [Candidatus Gastranaerophilales bacterium HUM_21]HIU91609.1 TIGR00159 family protein [Candidatus Limenecus avicola]